MDLGLVGKIALVTGGSRGIGRATALKLAEEGCHLGVCGRDADGLAHVADELRAAAVPTGEADQVRRVHTVQADVTATGEVERFVDESAAALGGVDLLVANVGGSSGGDIVTASPEDWLRTFELNLFHAVRAIRAAVPHMIARGGGSAVIVASILFDLMKDKLRAGLRQVVAAHQPRHAVRDAQLITTQSRTSGTIDAVARAQGWSGSWTSAGG